MEERRRGGSGGSKMGEDCLRQPRGAVTITESTWYSVSEAFRVMGPLGPVEETESMGVFSLMMPAEMAGVAKWSRMGL